MPRRVYLDDAAATAVDPVVRKTMAPFWHERFGNPSSLHREGVEARNAIAEARGTIAGCLGAHADEILFTGSGTEANNLALFGIAGLATKKRHLVISTIEHPSVSEAAAELKRRGFTVTTVPVGADGLVDPKVFASALRDDTLLASIIFANNEIGTIQPIAELGKVCAKRGVLFHSDACQAAPWLPLRVEKLHTDVLTVNAAKMHGPKGIGVLYVRRRLQLKPLLFGGGQEQGLRSGTENVPGIVGFAAAFRLAQQRQAADAAKVERVREALVEALTALPGVRLNGDRRRRLPNNVNVSIDGVVGETLVLALDAAGIAASSGSACSALHDTGSPVLKAIGAQGEGNVRFSLDRQTTIKDVRRVVAALKDFLARQRPLQAVWQEALTKEPTSHGHHA